MNQIKLIINNKEVIGNEGDSILKIATDNGIEIPNLCNSPDLAVFGGCGLCTVEVEGMPRLLRACATKATDGMKVNINSDRVNHSRKIMLELLMSDHDGDCVGPCKLNCPAETDVQAYLKCIANKDYHGAVAIIKDKIPLPASVGRVCPHPCESACRRGLVDEALSIAALKAYAADRDMASEPFVPFCKVDTGKTIGVIGGGPAGLTAAYFLRIMGHDVTVYDAMPQMGGMFRYGIPSYRLPKDILDAEISLIVSLGVKMKNNVKISKDATFDEIKAMHDAIVVAVGAWSSMPLRCVGENLDGVVGGIDFLREVALHNAGVRKENIKMGERVAVVGGGNTAMDACRSAVRLGAKEVYVIYRRTRSEMPAEEDEIKESEEEGVVYKFLRNPDEIVGENGKVKRVKLQVMELGEPDESGRRSPVPVEGKFEYLDVDTVIMAIGQKIDKTGFETLEYNKKGNILADTNTFETNVDGVFAVGDATNKGASIAIEAIGEANRAAKVVDSYLSGKIIPFRKNFVSKRNVTADMLKDKEKIPRIKTNLRSANERKSDFSDIRLVLDEGKVTEEASRCLECGCFDYKDCKLIRYANAIDINPERFKGAVNTHPIEQKLICIERNPGKCILCGLCVRTCDEIVHKGILGHIGRGFTTVIKPEFNKYEIISLCKDCHKCFDVCPTGALKLLEK